MALAAWSIRGQLEIAADVIGTRDGVSECRLHRGRIRGEPREIRHPRDLPPRQAHLCDDGDNQRLPREDGDRPY
jgi:hypothetical protein